MKEGFMLSALNTPRDIRERYPQLETITAMFADSNGIMRGKILPASGLEKLYAEGVYLPASVFGTDATGESVATTGLVWETGDKDFPWRIIPDTFHILPGTDGREAGVMMQMMTDEGNPHPLDPRSILEHALVMLADQGIHPIIAPELEFYLIDPALDEMGMGRAAIIPAQGQGQLTNQIYGIDAYDEFKPVIEAIKVACQDIAVGADTAIAEYGRGQFEINLTHRNDALRACDEAALLRRLARLVARQHGLDVTFMGKPFADDTGSGFHLHVSLWDKEGRNLLREEEGESADSNPNLRYAVGGMGHYLGDSMAVLSPNANAWRRIQPGHYAPIDRSWGENNRTVSFRIPPGNPEHRRLEHRCGSADVNPYLATTLILGAMAEGMADKITPPAITTGNAYASPDREGLPATWAEANACFRASTFIGRWLGEEYQHVYSETKEYERLTFNSTITPLEWAWYR